MKQKKITEKAIVDKIRKICQQKKYIILKTAGNIYEKAGRADLTGIDPVNGKRIEIEVKKPTGRLSEKQMKYLQVMKIAKAIVICLDSENYIDSYFFCENKNCKTYYDNKEQRGNICIFCGKRQKRK
jgi:penicillin-binding protein-related factor A (putative recombinase)